MNTLFIKDFRYGLDTRKSELTQRPGSLEVFTNGFINQGGEIEVRKAFVRTARVSGTYGLQSTSAGLYTFGSTDLSGSHPLNIGTVGNPIYVNFQRLRHPSQLVTSPIAYDAAKHLMTAVIFSTEYRGKAFVVATFSDTKSFCYYDGTLMYDFTDGLTLAYMVNDTTAIAAAIAAMVNRQTDYSAVSASAVATITGPAAQAFNVESTEDAAGSLTLARTSTPTAGPLGREAVGSFRIMAGSLSAGTNEIQNIEIGPSGGSFVSIISATDIDWTISNEYTATQCANAINSQVSSTDYTAEADQNKVIIKSLLADGDTPNDYVVKVTTAGNVCIGKAQYQVMDNGVSAAWVVTSIMVNGVDVKGALSTTYAAPPSTYAASIATAINAGTTAGAAHGILANATGAILSLSKNVTRSDDLPLSVVFNLTNTAPGHGIFERDSDLGASIRPLIISLGYTYLGRVVVSNSTARHQWQVFAIVNGGITPYLALVWTGNGASVIDSRNALIVGPLFNSGNVTPDFVPLTIPITCKVTDSNGNTATASLP